MLGINSDPVTIKQVEVTIIDRAWAEGWVVPVRPDRQTGKRVAVIGSGPSGLAAAQQLTRAGHAVVVHERADRPGGLLRYGIPEFKMEKRVLDRRLQQMVDEGTSFVTSCDAGVTVTGQDLLAGFDAVVLAGGATVARDLPIPGRQLAGIHQAMEYLPPSNRVQQGDLEASPISAEGKRVIIIGGGDTGAGLPGHRPPAGRRIGAPAGDHAPAAGRARDPSTPWPLWPLMFRTSSAHEEGGERVFAVNTSYFADDGNGRVAGLHLHPGRRCRSSEGRPNFEKIEETDFDLPADLVLLALGFVRALPSPVLLDQLGVSLTPRAWSAGTPPGRPTSTGSTSAATWAGPEPHRPGRSPRCRSCAAAVDSWLMGSTLLPAAP